VAASGGHLTKGRGVAPNGTTVMVNVLLGLAF
jgi:hypothetical protein